MRRSASTLGMALLILWGAAARAGNLQAPNGTVPSVRVLVCNDTQEAFEVAVDDGAFEALPRSGCLVLRMVPGQRVLTPRGDRVGGPFFTHAAWSVRIPEEGAVLRFGLRGDLVDLVDVLAGFPEGAPPAAAVDAGAEPFYLAPVMGAPLASWYVCAPPLVPVRVWFDQVHAFHLLPGACGSILAPVGWHTLAYYDPAGALLCPAYRGYLPPAGGSIFVDRYAPEGGVHRDRYAFRPGPPGRPPLPPRLSLVRARPGLRSLPKFAVNALSRERARLVRVQAIRSRMRGVGSARPSRARDWAAVARRGSGWVIGPRTPRPPDGRAARSPAARVFSTRGWRRYSREGSPRGWTRPRGPGGWSRWASRGYARGGARPAGRPSHRASARIATRPASRAFPHRTSARGGSRPAPRAFTYSTTARSWSRPSGGSYRGGAARVSSGGYRGRGR